MTGAGSGTRLLCITGLTPQVLTETLYALATEPNTRLPNEIRLLSTAEGVERARLTLLSDEPGWFGRLCRDYGLPPIRFDADCLHVLTDRDGAPLHDIRNANENAAAADCITDWVRRLTAEDDSALHVSLAGGRKTMGFFAGYALSLFGRPRDRLSHVLVEAPFESHPGFFYPTPYPEVIYAPPPDQRPLDTRDAVVTLADIPFVRLREGLPQRLLSGRASFSDTVHIAQRVLDKPQLTLDTAGRCVTAGGETISLAPADFAFYLWFVRRRLNGDPPVRSTEPDVHHEYLAVYQDVAGGEWADTDRVVSALAQGFTKEWFEQRKSKTNRALIAALGEAVARPYLITGEGRRPKTRFGLTLEAEAICVA
ncbi:CRISPR-associated ring nuclease Csm6 [Methylolobus aquaticus]